MYGDGTSGWSGCRNVSCARGPGPRRVTHSPWSPCHPHSREPDVGAPATETTEIRILYDDHSLYVGVRALDREPDQVIARILQRDRLMSSDFGGRIQFAGDDGVALLFDPFHDLDAGAVRMQRIDQKIPRLGH